MTGRIPLISEIFGPVIQGEGPRAGEPTIFVRTATCDFRCSWCDTLYAVEPSNRDDWTLMEGCDVLERIIALAGDSRPTITLSGGNPALWDLGALCLLLHARGHNIAIETQASIKPPSWHSMVDFVVLSPKPPSSGMPQRFEALQHWLTVRPDAAIKVVVGGEPDLDFLGEVKLLARSMGFDGLIYAQPMNPDGAMDTWRDELMALYNALARDVIARGWTDVRVLPQLHVLAEGGGKGI